MSRDLFRDYVTTVSVLYRRSAARHRRMAAHRVLAVTMGVFLLIGFILGFSVNNPVQWLKCQSIEARLHEHEQIR